MLVLFAILGVGYAIFAGQYRRAAVAFSRAGQQEDPPMELLDSAMYDLVRGTNDVDSSIVGHDLLGDVYGNDWFLASVSGASLVTIPQASPNPPLPTEIVVLNYNASSWGSGATRRFDSGHPFFPATNQPPDADYYAGCVVTIFGGIFDQQSARILRFRPWNVGQDGGWGVYNSDDDGDGAVDNLSEAGWPGSDDVRGDQIVLTGLKTDSTDAANALTVTNVNSAFAGARFRINGRPFNGPGYGYQDYDSSGNRVGNLNDAITLNLSTGSLSMPVILTPNYSLNPSAVANGASDESHDVPDYNDMFLAYIFDGVTSSGEIIPSFHRPELINYWFSRIARNTSITDFDKQAVMNRIVLRPMPWRHPYFTGGNLAMTSSVLNPAATTDSIINALVNGPWDVDNDNDGIADSIWLDLGFSARSNSRGNLVKPLFAILCQ
ncbi:MAG: hypothetical protein KDA47_23340, partial [Planctomycetales bacterium]|nr:hypothetical protein [Planctomycetales bacterium]